MSKTYTGSESKPGSTRHAGLDRNDVIAAALTMVEQGGGEALTMRRLAAELGVATTTIYWHVGNRNDLVLALVKRQAEHQATTPVNGDSPRERIASASLNIWRNALAHRNVTALASQVGATTLLELPLEIALVVELEAAGVTGKAARNGLRSILGCIAGFLVVAWRREDMAEELRPSALWAAVEDGHISAETKAALGEPVDLDEVVNSTIDSVIRGILENG
ncbi:MAG: TetR family transcriptional regulator [Microthrixaceae bacterium]